MTGDLVIEEGDLEVLRDRVRDLSGRLQLMTVATADDYISSGVGGSELAGQGRGAGDAIDETVIALTRGLGDFPQSVDDSISEYTAAEDDAAASFQQVRHNGLAMAMGDLLHMGEER